jgi:DNA-binding NarL/FixJ family response regulator
MGMIQVVIVAPVLALRAGLRALLEAGPLEVETVAEAARLEDLGDVPEADVLILTPEGADLDALSEVLGAHPGQAAVLLLAEEARTGAGALAAYSQSDLPARAWGALSLDASPEELGAAVWALANGLWVGSGEIFQQQAALPAALPAREADLLEPLTDRELEVLQLLAQGLANKQIALALNISEHTVKFHVSAVYSKLRAANRTEAVRLGVQRGLVSL